MRARVVAVACVLVVLNAVPAQAVVAPRNHAAADATISLDGSAVGRIHLDLAEPTADQLVPGQYTFDGFAGWDVKAQRSVINEVGFWYDPTGGLYENPVNVAFFAGQECAYYATPGDVSCRSFEAMAIDGLASGPDQFMMRWSDTEELWFTISAGTVTVKLAKG